MELAFIEEAIPKITRAGGSGREAEPWEDHLAPLKDAGRAGKDFRVWTYDKRPSAVSRMTGVRERLTKAVPFENWDLAVRPVPGTETAVHPEGAVDPAGNSIAGTSATQFGVYVSFRGQFTDEQVAENVKRHQERSDRVKAARAKAEAERKATAASAAEPTPEETAATAKERVAAARAKQTASA